MSVFVVKKLYAKSRANKTGEEENTHAAGRRRREERRIIGIGISEEITTFPMGTMPLVLIPAFLVPVFLMLHIVSLLQARRLAMAGKGVCSWTEPTSVPNADHAYVMTDERGRMVYGKGQYDQYNKNYSRTWQARDPYYKGL
jgi:hypothetical protein